MASNAPAPSTPLLTLLTGRAVPYTRPGTLSAIAKSATPDRIHIGINGLGGDEQGDLRVHGGPDKAIHHYALDHYPQWREQLASPILEAPGAFGENFSTLGWTERNVHFGDVIQAGSALLEVSQARQPCWKLNDRFNHPRAAALLQSSGRTGWYYRVLREGSVQVGDQLSVVDRPFDHWPLSRLLDLLFHRTLDQGLLVEASKLPLTPSWAKLVQHRLERNETESWAKRLEGPNGPSDG